MSGSITFMQVVSSLYCVTLYGVQDAGERFSIKLSYLNKRRGVYTGKISKFPILSG